MSKQLLVAAGFEAGMWSAQLSQSIEREIRAIVPKWAAVLSECYGWKWPLMLSGLKTWQIGVDKEWQVIGVSGPNSSFSLKGLVC